mmetsp:Transcript_3182/g.12786  ORF Transcript_3182/g.12786 Transcript_3182/m.12786 type:complete len:135 (-) Transcript_3182:340-744(-)|eukprot:scaffold48_cov311-Pinguiococcus_pyrenoidosus.AAC.132
MLSRIVRSSAALARLVQPVIRLQAGGHRSAAQLRGAALCDFAVRWHSESVVEEGGKGSQVEEVVRGGKQDHIRTDLEETELMADEDFVDDEDWEEMFVKGPAGVEWGGPRRGGRLEEPTRFGDWERKGRCTDFS